MHASQAKLAESKQTLLEEHNILEKQSWWQKFSQSINLAGTWLFMQVLFVSDNNALLLLFVCKTWTGDLPAALAVYMPFMPSAVSAMFPCVNDAA